MLPIPVAVGLPFQVLCESFRTRNVAQEHGDGLTGVLIFTIHAVRVSGPRKSSRHPVFLNYPATGLARFLRPYPSPEPSVKYLLAFEFEE